MCDECPWASYLEKIEDILEEKKLRSSDKEFLEGVYEWVEQNQHITSKQIHYVEKIADKD